MIKAGNRCLRSCIPPELIIGGLLLLAAGGCSSIDLDSARALGKAGQDTAQATSQSILPIGGRMDRYVDELAFVGAIRGNPHLDPDAQNSLAVIRKNIEARRRAFTRLATAYVAFADLAAYDAGAAITGALKELGSAVNDYGAAAGGTSAVVDSGTLDLAASVGGIIADEAKKRRILQSSVVLRGQVEKLRDFMKSGTERQAIVGFDDAVAREDLLTTELLWRMHRVDATPFVADMVTPSGLKLIERPLAADDPQLAPAIKALFEERRTHLSPDAAAAYDAAVAALDELIRQHATLEAGAPVDVSGVAAQTAALRQIVDKVTTALKP